MEYVIAAPPLTTLPVDGDERRFPVRRVFCVGRNYAGHAREMGHDPDREPPFFFTKPADAVVPGGGGIPYPPATRDLHHEVELVVALGKGGVDISRGAGLDHVFGYAVGIDPDPPRPPGGGQGQRGPGTWPRRSTARRP